MNQLNKKLQSAYQRQKGSIINESKNADTTLLEVLEYSPEAANATSAISSSLKSIFGGKLEVDNIQLYRLRKDGFEHFYIQPFSGLNPIPGEHHAILGGNFTHPIALTRTMFGGGKWDTEDKELEGLLKRDRALKKITDEVKWDWAIGFGTVKLDWTVQMCPMDDGTSHLIVKAGRYGGITTFHVGFELFLILAQHFTNMLPSETLSEKQAFLIEPQYADLIRHTLSMGPSETTMESAITDMPTSKLAKGEESPAGGLSDFSDLIRSILRPLEGKKVHVDHLPSKKEKNVRKHVLPDNVQDAPIVAVIDITMLFSSAKDAIVFTANHCYAKEIDDTIDFPLSDLMLVYGFTSMLEDKIDVEVKRLGRLTIPCGGQGKAALEVLQRIAVQ
jgi:hypothetical protein